MSVLISFMIVLPRLLGAHEVFRGPCLDQIHDDEPGRPGRLKGNPSTFACGANVGGIYLDVDPVRTHSVDERDAPPGLLIPPRRIRHAEPP